MSDLFDVAIIGGGAAGLSAALVLGRSRRTVLVCDEGRPRNAVAKAMHGFLSREGMPPSELLAIGREELRRYPSVRFVRTRVEAVRRNTVFTIECTQHASYRASRVMLATGVYDRLPDIPGLQERWGSSVFVCPYCDGWEVRDKRLAILGKGKKAVELAQELAHWSSDLLVCTQAAQDVTAEQRRWLDRTTVAVRDERVAGIDGRHSGAAIVFEHGDDERCDAIFLCAPLRQKYPLVDMLGCRIGDDGEIVVDNGGRTSVPGVYAAGDAVTAVHQVVLAAASGVCAAMAINEDLMAETTR